MKRIFILFGASGDLGNAAVKYFLNSNFDYYYFISRKPINIQSDNKKYKFLQTDDLTEESQVEKVFSKIEKDSSSQFFLFNTIGGFSGGNKIYQTNLSEVKNLLDKNLISSFLIAKHFAKFIIGTGGGSICFTSAYSSVQNEIGKFAYGLSKNGLNYLVKTLAEEGKEIKLSANAVAPNIIDTPANREWVKDVKSMVRPDEICGKVNSLFEQWESVTGEIFLL